MKILQSFFFTFYLFFYFFLSFLQAGILDHKLPLLRTRCPLYSRIGFWQQGKGWGDSWVDGGKNAFPFCVCVHMCVCAHLCVRLQTSATVIAAWLQPELLWAPADLSVCRMMALYTRVECSETLVFIFSLWHRHCLDFMKQVSNLLSNLKIEGTHNFKANSSLI